jgi:hypothetical protein
MRMTSRPNRARLCPICSVRGATSPSLSSAPSTLGEDCSTLLLAEVPNVQPVCGPLRKDLTLITASGLLPPLPKLCVPHWFLFFLSFFFFFFVLFKPTAVNVAFLHLLDFTNHFI